MLLRINGKFTIGKLKSSLCREVSFLTDPHCRFRGADLFLYSYEADFIQGLLKKNEKKLARSFNFTFRYIDGVLSLDNSRFGDFVDLIYPIELEIKDRPPKITNMLSIKDSRMLIISVSEN
jgi:hypothetical protein